MTQTREPVWTPTSGDLHDSEMADLMRSVGAADYQELWRWSVEDLDRFWRTMWARFDILADGDPAVGLAEAGMPGAVWFPNVRLSFAEHVFRERDLDAVAIVSVSENGSEEWTWQRLREETCRIRSGLQTMGVQQGDRIAGYLPNVPETVAAFLAVSSLGAVWTCCSPDLGSRTVVDRLAQVEPKVLLYCGEYSYNGATRAGAATLDYLMGHLPTVDRAVCLTDRNDWNTAFPQTDTPLSFDRVPFDHPLWIVYSSGSTGLPKPIVHGHGGVLLENLKAWRLHQDVGAEDTVLWSSSTAWIVWNIMVGAMLTGARIVTYHGSPSYPDWGALWDIAARTETTVLGAGAAVFHAQMRHGIEPATGRDLRALRSVMSSGSPLSPEAYHWIAETFGGRVWPTSSSGGTDVAGAFVGGSPTVPVYAGEIPVPMLGVAVHAFDEAGTEVVDKEGELVVTAPMPSMPVGFWNDTDRQRYRDAYFDLYPGVWRHGDWIRITPRGSIVIYGRSDSTINRDGIRIGTAEIYNAISTLEPVLDALAVDVPSPGTDGTILLFVVIDDDQSKSMDFDRLSVELRDRIKRDCSPRHVPDHIVVAPGIPRTLTGKVMEVPIKRLLMGHDACTVANPDSMANPEIIKWYNEFAERMISERLSFA